MRPVANGGSPLRSIRNVRQLLVAGDKSGVSKKNFYKQLIAKADKRLGRAFKPLETQRIETEGKEVGHVQKRKRHH